MLGCPNSRRGPSRTRGRPDARPLAPRTARRPRAAIPHAGARRLGVRRRLGGAAARRPRRGRRGAHRRAGLADRHRPRRHARPDRHPAPRPWRRRRRQRDARLPRGPRGILVLAAITAGLQRRPTASTAGRSRPARASALLASVATWFVASRRIGAPRRGEPRRPGRDRPARGRRPARRHELVLPPHLLDRLDLEPQPPPPAPARRASAAQRRRCSSASRCSGSRASTARASRSSSSCRTSGCSTGRASCPGRRARARRSPLAVGVADVRPRQRSSRTSGMLVVTGVLLGVVLVVMVGESVQELQLAGWLPTTTIAGRVPGLARAVVRGVPDGRGAGRPGRSPPRS